MDIIESGIVKNNDTGLIKYDDDFGFICRYDFPSGWHTISVNHETFYG